MSEDRDAKLEEVEDQVNSYAKKGWRTIGIARSKQVDSDEEAEEAGVYFVGLLAIYDPPWEDTAATIKAAKDLGARVMMITGDQLAIAKQTASDVGMGSHILSSEGINNEALLRNNVEITDGFAEVFPEHKYAVVEALLNNGHKVGMTGDGVNDAPALKRATVGIAVHDSTEAARAAADIVLTSPGLSTIKEAMILSRKIFQKMRNYAIYRIACTLQLLVFFFLSLLIFEPQRFASASDEYFCIPVICIVIITVMNDGCILSIA